MAAASPYRLHEHGFWRSPPAGESRMLAALGLHLHCVVAGQGEPPLVLLHGLGGSWDNWLPVIAPLSERRRLYAPDLPGCGRSPKPQAPYSVAWLAAVARDLLGREGALPAVLCGNSLGGHIALEYALRWPREVSALVLSAPAGGHRFPSLKASAMLTAARLLGRGRLAATLGPRVAPWFIRRLFHRCGPECQEQAAFYQHYFRSPDCPLFLRAATRAASSHLRGGLLSRAHQLRMPALIIAGRFDAAIPLAQVEGLARRIPRCRLAVFECGHAPQLEEPGRFVAEVEGFLASL